MSILQASGRYLDDIYLTVDQPITADEMTTALDLAATTGYRLAALT